MGNYLKKAGMADLSVWIVFVIAIISAYFLMEAVGLGEMMTSSLAGKFINAVMAIIFLRLTLVILDRVIGFKFSEWVSASSATDKAIYFSARFVAVAIMFGMIIG